MLTLQYPSIPYSPEYEIEPLAPSARVRAAPNGRAYVQTLSVYDDAQTTITHPWVTQGQRDEILQFWLDARAEEFQWTDKLGDIWLARFLARPTVRREKNQYRWTLSVNLLLRRNDQ